MTHQQAYEAVTAARFDGLTRGTRQTLEAIADALLVPVATTVGRNGVRYPRSMRAIAVECVATARVFGPGVDA